MNDAPQHMVASKSAPFAAPGPLVVGIDHSNILIRAQDHARQLKEPLAENLRLDIRNLVRLAIAGRMLTCGVAVGSRIQSTSPMQLIYERVGFEGIFLERGVVSGREVGVDVTLASELQWCCMERTPGTVVLLTSDGAGYRRGRGFFALLERMHHLGWSVELLTYEDTAHQAMVEWVKSSGFFGDLADFHESVTFIPGQRFSTPLANPNEWRECRIQEQADRCIA